MTDQRLVIHSCSRTYNNIGWYNQPVFGLDKQSTPAAVGEHLRSALNASIWDSRSDDAELTPHPVVVDAGYKSWDALERHSQLVNVDTDREIITLTPNRPAVSGEGRGFLPLDDEMIEIPWRAVDSEIGEAMLSAFCIATRKESRATK